LPGPVHIRSPKPDPRATASRSRRRRHLGPTRNCGPPIPMCAADGGTDRSISGFKAATTWTLHLSVSVRPCRR
jgi:hypothetical protein